MHSYTCPKCRKTILDEQDHGGCEFSVQAPTLSECKPSWVTVLGDSGQGKTTYIESLLLVLTKLQTRLPGFAIHGLDTHTKIMLKQRLQPESRTAISTSSMPEPLLLDFFGFPTCHVGETERRNMFLYDTPGEYLKTGGEVDVPELAEIFPQVQMPWLLYELSPDNKHGDRVPLGELASNLLIRYRENNLSLDGKSLLIVYTMSQRLLEHFPVELQEYLNSDSLFGKDHLHADYLRNFELSSYMERAAKVSETLKNLTANYSHGGALLLQLAKSHNITLQFCMVESVGHDVGDGKFHDERSPKRVLDPLFWSVFQDQDQTIRHPNKSGKKRVLVAINPDLGRDSEWYKNGYLSEIWKLLGRQFDLDFYFMGREQPEVSSPSMPPTGPPKRPCSHLIGPILDRNPDANTVLVISDTPPLDLFDYEHSSIQEHLRMLVCDEDARDHWSPTLLVRSADDFASIKNQL